MGKLWMVAGRQVQGSDGQDRFGAYVVLSAGRMSRIFSVRGGAEATRVTELPAATTVDMRRFESELEKDLLAEAGSPSVHASTRPHEAVVCGAVRAHLRSSEGLDVE
jgi:hypothetical protein